MDQPPNQTGSLKGRVIEWLLIILLIVLFFAGLGTQLFKAVGWQTGLLVLFVGAVIVGIAAIVDRLRGYTYTPPPPKESKPWLSGWVKATLWVVGLTLSIGYHIINHYTWTWNQGLMFIAWVFWVYVLVDELRKARAIRQ